jgi:DNA-binding NarL/FixJ family response regulator
MDRKQSQAGFKGPLQCSVQTRLPRSGELSSKQEPLEFDDDTVANIIDALIIDVHPIADSVLRAIAEDLTAQERVVLFAYLRTPAIKQVAGRLGKHEQTIRNQLNAIREKLAADSMIELVCKVFISQIAYEQIAYKLMKP